MRITSLSQTIGLAADGERCVRITNLSLPAPVTGTFLEALGQVRKHYTAFGVRTGRTRQNCFAKSKGEANALPLAVGGRERGVILTNLSSPLPGRTRFANGFATCATALRRKAKQLLRQRLSAERFGSTRPVRAPKAEQWRSTWPSASKDGEATGQGGERFVRIAHLSRRTTC